jgi:hypothetical protein
LGFRERDLADPRKTGVIEGGGVFDQIHDFEVVADGLGVLVVGKRVDPRRIGDLPALLRDPDYGGQGLPVEDGARIGRQKEDDAVVLSVDVLHRLEREELRVVRGEFVAVVRAGYGVARAVSGGGDADKNQRDHNPAPAQDGVGVGHYESVAAGVGDVFRLHGSKASDTKAGVHLKDLQTGNLARVVAER